MNKCEEEGKVEEVHAIIKSN